MWKAIFSFIVAVSVAPCMAAEGWLCDMAEAKKQAAEQNKGILIEFTGTDWCNPCKVLHATVLSKKEFMDEAGKSFVLLQLDYPMHYNQPKEIRQANRVLKEEYAIKGFPTVLFADAKGRPFGGFIGVNNMERTLAAMRMALKNQEAIIAQEAKVEQAATDEEKIRAMAELLKLLPEKLSGRFYHDLKAEIIRLDKNDLSGLKAEEARLELVKKEGAELKAYFKDKKQLSPAERLKLIKDYPGREKLQPETVQALYMIEAGALEQNGDVDAAIICLDKACRLLPNSKDGQAAAIMKMSLLTKKR